MNVFTTATFRTKTIAKLDAINQLRQAAYRYRATDIQVTGTKGAWSWANPGDFASSSQGDGLLRVSKVPGACRIVWDITEQVLADNPRAKRRDILKLCTDQGIAYFTARNQYQLYRNAVRGI